MMSSASTLISTSASAPIGIFDSGVGGLSVWRALTAALPAESTIYVADQAHVPYGARPAQEIAELTHAAVAWLWAQGAKLVVVACNTASAAALTSLRQRWPDAAIVGMEPAVKPASEHTLTGKVGVMATPGTLQAERFNHLVTRFAGGIEVYTVVCPGLVERIEAGETEGPALERDLEGWVAPLVSVGVDQLVMGCTHFPFVMPTLQRVVGPQVTLIDPAPAVAQQARRVLAQRGSLAPIALTIAPAHHFFTTGAAGQLSLALKKLAGLASPDVAACSFAPAPIVAGK